MISKNISVVFQKKNVTDVLPQELDSAPNSFFTQLLVENGILEQSDDKFLDKLISKVRIDGKIILKGVECIEVCRRVYYGELDCNNEYFKNSKNFYSITKLKDIFSNNKWQIDFVGIDNINFDFEATRKS